MAAEKLEKREHTGLLAVGRNCWRIEHASRAGVLVDADAYFKAFVEAARHAQRSILITGWDFHSRTRLLCADGKDCELELGHFLNDLVRRRRELQVHILIWDYPGDLRARPRVGAAVWPVVEAAPPDLLSLRQHAPDRRLAPSEDRGRSTMRSLSAAASI